jgi:hypothetical protein
VAIFPTSTSKEIVLTTIAYDTRQVRCDRIVSDDCQKMTVVDGVSFFLSGAVCDEKALIAAYFGTPSPVAVECSGYAEAGGKLLMVGHDDKTGIWRQELDPGNPDAIGSGSAFALAAMDMGASAEEAVHAAMKRDIYTGGKVVTFRVAG